jgi:hypothetical protein
MGNDDSRRPPVRVSAIDAGWDDAPTETEAPEGVTDDLSAQPHTGLADTPKPRTPKPPSSKRDPSPLPTPSPSRKVPPALSPLSMRTEPGPPRSLTPTGVRAAPRPIERKPPVETMAPVPVAVAPIAVVGPPVVAEEAPEPTLPDASVAPHEYGSARPPVTPASQEGQPRGGTLVDDRAYAPALHPAVAAAPRPIAADGMQAAFLDSPSPAPLALSAAPLPVEISSKGASSGSFGRVIGAFAVGCVLAGAGAFVAGRMTAPKVVPKTSPTQVVTASTSASFGAVPSAATPLERAASGDADAMKALQSRAATDRVAEESLALASGRASQRRSELAALGEKVRSPGGRPADAAAVQLLMRYAKDTETTVDAQRIMATLPAPQAADLIYEVWVGTPLRNPTTELAEALVYSKEVRAKASPALAVALDLRVAQNCDEFAAILPRATEVGDRRSQALLGRLVMRAGCGPTHREDCYACLHPRKTLELAIRAVMGRPSPRF